MWYIYYLRNWGGGEGAMLIAGGGGGGAYLLLWPSGWALIRAWTLNRGHNTVDRRQPVVRAVLDEILVFSTSSFSAVFAVSSIKDGSIGMETHRAILPSWHFTGIVTFIHYSYSQQYLLSSFWNSNLKIQENNIAVYRVSLKKLSFPARAEGLEKRSTILVKGISMRVILDGHRSRARAYCPSLRRPARNCFHLKCLEASFNNRMHVPVK